MAKEAVNHGIHWEARRELHNPIGYKPEGKRVVAPWILPVPPATFGSVIDSPQPDVDWEPHSERRYDLFGRLWKPNRWEGEGEQEV